MSKKNIIIVGAGGMGREVCNWIEASGEEMAISGFIDDNLAALDGFSYPYSMISNISDHIVDPLNYYVLAIMNPAAKKKIVQKIKLANGQFLTFIHPTAIIGRNVEIGKGVVITPGCILSCDINVGDFVFLNTQTTLGHDVKIGAYTSINGKVEISGFVEIGEEVTIGSRVVVLPKKKVISGANIGAGSVVVGNINKPITVFGNPAKRIS